MLHKELEGISRRGSLSKDLLVWSVSPKDLCGSVLHANGTQQHKSSESGGHGVIEDESCQEPSLPSKMSEVGVPKGMMSGSYSGARPFRALWVSLSSLSHGTSALVFADAATRLANAFCPLLMLCLDWRLCHYHHQVLFSTLPSSAL